MRKDMAENALMDPMADFCKAMRTDCVARGKVIANDLFDGVMAEVMGEVLGDILAQSVSCSIGGSLFESNEVASNRREVWYGVEHVPGETVTG